VVEGRHQQVAVGIGEAVGDDHAVGRPLQHAQDAVVRAGSSSGAAEKAGAVGSGPPRVGLHLFGGCPAVVALNVSQSPRGPQCVVIHPPMLSENPDKRLWLSVEKVIPEAIPWPDNRPKQPAGRFRPDQH